MLLGWVLGFAAGSFAIGYVTARWEAVVVVLVALVALSILVVNPAVASQDDAAGLKALFTGLVIVPCTGAVVTGVLVGGRRGRSPGR